MNQVKVPKFSGSIGAKSKAASPFEMKLKQGNDKIPQKTERPTRVKIK
jgi:hypothetical protein